MKQFSKEQLKGIKLFVATPMYGGIGTWGYLRGMCDLAAACQLYNIPLVLYEVTDQSLISLARNRCAHAFLQSDFTHFLFIDADIHFTAESALGLLQLMQNDVEQKYDIIGGPYPKKEISWSKVRKSFEKGLVEKDNLLEKYTGSFFFSCSPGSFPSYTEPFEVLQLGTGFTMIPRKTFEMFIQAYPEKAYKNFNEEKEYAFFDCEIDPKTKAYVSEDYFFCQHIRKIGGKIWLVPTIDLGHEGLHSFQGFFRHLKDLDLDPIDPVNI